MHSWLRHMALASALVFAGSAQAATSTTTRTSRSTAAPHPTPTGVQLPQDEKSFLDWIHQLNQQEVQLGQLAQQQSETPAVKQYGRMLVADHRAADAKVMAYAQKKGWTLGAFQPTTEVEQKVQAAGQATTAELQALTGGMFDHAFLAAMVGGHDAAIATLDEGLLQYKDTDSLLKPLVKTLHKHRDHAYRLLGQMKMKNV